MSRPVPKLAIISIPVADLIGGAEAYVKLPFTADFIIFPPMVPVPSVDHSGQYIPSPANGDAGISYGIRVNDQSNPLLPFGPVGGGNAQGLSVFEGTVSAIYIRRLDPSSPSYPVYLIVGTDCDLGFFGAVANL